MISVDLAQDSDSGSVHLRLVTNNNPIPDQALCGLALTEYTKGWWEEVTDGTWDADKTCHDCFSFLVSELEALAKGGK